MPRRKGLPSGYQKISIAGEAPLSLPEVIKTKKQKCFLEKGEIGRRLDSEGKLWRHVLDSDGITVA
ncbi:hypothetical protein TWF694_008260 [Orbilia ellipsospora]|uniref:Uncharacterized protein n=1 Tax=Orbilia ellipsospora TaxID=2528407 RepID=A0AAV9XIY4_9PEZI